MSTFGGVMEEFPDIRVDYFRQIPLLRPPLACFLSHVHSDHLAGLETLKSPFVYCSAATKAILLRLERYPHRMNFAKGILEARKQHYKPLKNLLKPIPLETPTRIELAPGNEIQVTLFDANHCTGAVMFLIEGQGRAVLYTGDIRSEPWFVNNIARNPLLIEYTTGLKTLNCIYLDTSNIEPISFPTKAEGLKELLTKVAAYPADTIFHFSAWTFGYEDVWKALSKALNSQVHVDDYKFRVYKALRGDSATDSSSLVSEGPALAGYQCGNAPQHGCLTRDPSARIHSCEKGTDCPAIDGKIVWIRPIIARTEEGIEIGEIGVGGGGGDLTQSPKLEVDSDDVLEYLLSLLGTVDPRKLLEIKKKLLLGFKSQGKAVSLDDMGLNRDADELSLEDLAKAFARSFAQNHKERSSKDKAAGKIEGTSLPNLITFPYSRHSSYEETCHLIKLFKPYDVYPCTVDEENWHSGISIKALFGQYCSGHVFRHDLQMEYAHPDSSGPQDQLHSSMQLSTLVSLCPVSSRAVVDLQEPTKKNGENNIITCSFYGSSDPPDAYSDGSFVNPNVQDELRGQHVTAFNTVNTKAANPETRFAPLSDEIPLLQSITGIEQKHLESLLAAGFVTMQSVAYAPLRILKSITGATEKEMEIIVTRASQQIRVHEREVSVYTTPSKGTTSRETIGASPGSASQRVRRRALFDGFENSRAKRPRLDGGTNLNLSGTTAGAPEIHPFSRENQSPPLIDRDVGDSLSSQHSLPVGTPSEEDASDSEYVDSEAYYDSEDEVVRCKNCDYELWAPMGPCAGCGAGGTHFMEVIEPLQPVIMRLIDDEYVSETGTPNPMQQDLAEVYLDYQSSAYDSQDSVSIREEYEINSFIDDGSIPENDTEDGSSVDGETDYKAQFETVSASLNTLRQQHDSLVISHNYLLVDHEKLERDLLGSPSDSEGDSQDGEIKVVEVSPPDPILTEIVLPTQEESQQFEMLDTQGESQKSEIAEERNHARAEVSDVSQDENGMFTGENHTYEEVIL